MVQRPSVLTRPTLRLRLLGSPALLIVLASFLAACGGTPNPTLSVELAGNGSGTVRSTPAGIDCGAACVGTFATGQTVTLVAVPAGGSELAGWSGCDSVSGDSCRVTMTGSRTVRATFATGSISGTIVYPGDLVGPTAASAPPPASTRPGGDGAGDVVAGEVLVRFEPGTVRAAATLEVVGLRAVLVRRVAATDVHLYRAAGLGPERTLDLAAALRARPDVADATPNWIMRAQKAPNDTLYDPFQWHYAAINLPLAWDFEDGTTNPTTVAVLDSGVAAGHPDLVASLLPGYDFFDGDADPSDPGGTGGYHGTHVAGTVAAATDNAVGVAGVSWGGRVVPVRVLDGDGVGTLDAILVAVRWAAGFDVGGGVPVNANPARVINLSLGGSATGGCSSLVEEVFADVVAAGVAVVAAAGNFNEDARNTVPASCPSVFAVGATGPANTRAPYSNYGATVDVMAPGGDVSQTLSLGGESFPAGVLSTVAVGTGPSAEMTYAFYQGTSMATPHVAGVMALMLSDDPSLTPADLADRLRETARPLDAAACRRASGSDCGAGLIDAAAALSDDAVAPPPVFEPTPVPTYVVAFHCVADGSDPCAALDLDLSGETVVSTISNTVPYTVPGLTSGSYVVVAWQDLNQDLVVDEGEPIAIHPDLVVVAPGQARSGISLTMEPYEPLDGGSASHHTLLPTSPSDALARWLRVRP